MLASLSTRRALDAEAPVVWPAWCYSGEGGGGAARRCARNAAASPAHAQAPTPVPPAPQPHVKSERLSPHDSTASRCQTARVMENQNGCSSTVNSSSSSSPNSSSNGTHANGSRSRSVTPSTSSYPGTPPERGSPHAPPHPAPAHPPRNYSDIMRTLAAKYIQPNVENPYLVNGFKTESATTPPQNENGDTLFGGLFMSLAKHQGGPPRQPAFPLMMNMNTTRSMLSMSHVRTGRAGRKRRQAIADHCPLDLSAGGEIAAKRPRRSDSTRSESDRISNEDRCEARGECMCAEARARLSAWSVDEVCEFINSIDNCAEYSSYFRDQRIDGAVLPFITEEQLTGPLQMKLGPALKVKMALASLLEPCSQCQALNPGHTSTPLASGLKINGSSVKSEPRSDTTSPS